MADATSFLDSTIGKLPVLKRTMNPAVAAILGFLLGGIGLGLYFWSLLDFIIPIVVGIMFLAILHASGGWVLGAAFAGVYGALRALDSNKRRVVALESQPPV